MDGFVDSPISKNRCDRSVTGRIEVIGGPTGRRNWPDEVKGRIVAESFSGEVSVSAVARRHGLVPSQLFAWRRQARDGKLIIPIDDDAAFAPLVVAAPEPAPAIPVTDTPGPFSGIEIEADGIVVRLPLDVSCERLAGFVRVLRGTT